MNVEGAEIRAAYACNLAWRSLVIRDVKSSILRAEEDLPANHWILAAISGILTPGDDAAHAQELVEMAGIRWSINSVASLSSTDLH